MKWYEAITVGTRVYWDDDKGRMVTYEVAVIEPNRLRLTRPGKNSGHRTISMKEDPDWNPSVPDVVLPYGYFFSRRRLLAFRRQIIANRIEHLQKELAQALVDLEKADADCHKARPKE